jgi:multidrug resistance efflux pump
MSKKEKFQMQLEMKKITNRLTIMMVIAMIAGACSSDKKPKATQSSDQILKQVSEVKAIGKIIPAEDWALIASTTPALIKEVLVKEGDSVTKGQILIQLEQGNAPLDIKQELAKLNSIKAQNAISLEDIHRGKLHVQELQDKYETSKQLFSKNAETREVMETDYSNWRQEEFILEGLQKKYKAQQIAEKEQYLQIQKTKNLVTDFTIEARKSGIVMDLTAHVGQSISSTTELGKIVNVVEPIVEAEVDELFAQDVKVGQLVTISQVGRKDKAIEGHVIYTSPILSNKSILHETANEGEDRRVRKIKIQLSTNNELAINAKVDCTIKIK